MYGIRTYYLIDQTPLSSIKSKSIKFEGFIDFHAIFRNYYLSRRRNYHFYCVNTSYPMDNCFTGRRDICLRFGTLLKLVKEF